MNLFIKEPTYGELKERYLYLTKEEAKCKRNRDNKGRTEVLNEIIKVRQQLQEVIEKENIKGGRYR